MREGDPFRLPSVQQMSSHSNEQFASHWAAVAYDFDPQYQRQAPHPSDPGALMAGAVGSESDGVVGAADVGTVPLPAIANISTQSTGSTASTLFVMVTLLSAHASPVRVLSQSGKVPMRIPERALDFEVVLL